MNNTLVVPFFDQDPKYAYGVEFGMLYARMQVETEIADYFTIENQEQILLLANRLHWSVSELETTDCSGWFWVKMQATPTESVWSA